MLYGTLAALNLFSMLAFGSKVEKKREDYLSKVHDYLDATDRLTIICAIHVVDIWMGTVALLFLIAFLETFKNIVDVEHLLYAIVCLSLIHI